MSWIADSRFARVAPSLQRGADFSALQLSPEEGFVLSRVDGASTVEEICLITGLPRERTLDILEKLHQASVLFLPGAPTASTQPTTSSPAPAAGPPDGSSAHAKASDGPIEPRAGEEALPNIPPFSPDSGCDLSEDKQRSIHELYYQIEELDFYALLQLQPGCDGREVQRAYRKISMKYHPDRFFGKSLGIYKERLETIFRHVSNVADYLTDDAQRATYEAELRSAGDPTPESGTGPETAGQGGREAPVPAEAPAAAGAPEAAASSARTGDAGEPSSAELEALGRPRNLTREQRLRRLGGVLGMTTRELRAVARGRSTPTPPGVPSLSPERLARQGENTRGNSARAALSPLLQRLQKAREHYDEGVKAMLASNWANAASNLKLAITFDPKNQEYREKEQVASGRARQLAAEAYAKRATFEESLGHHEEAARLYAMAADRHETIELLTRAAGALARTGELKRAMDYAMKARDLNPNSVPARIGLATAYLAAGMPKNARREVDYVLKLDSDNRAAKALLKEIRRAE